MLSLLQEKTVLLNSQYIEYSQVIQHVADRLLRDVELLDMSPIELAHAKDFVRDHGKYICIDLQSNWGFRVLVGEYT